MGVQYCDGCGVGSDEATLVRNSDRWTPALVEAWSVLGWAFSCSACAQATEECGKEQATLNGKG